MPIESVHSILLFEKLSFRGPNWPGFRIVLVGICKLEGR